MIDHFTIFSKGGVVLWSITQAKLRGSPIDTLIRSVLLEERSAENSFNHDLYTLKWTFANEFELIFVVVYQKILSLFYIEELLEVVSAKFTERYAPQLKNLKNEIRNQEQFLEFTDVFSKILTALETRTAKQKTERLKGPRPFEKTDKGKAVKKEKEDKGKDSSKKKGKEEEETEDNQDEPSKEQEAPASEEDEMERKIREGRERLKARMSSSGKKTPPKTTATSPPKKRGDRKWDDVINKEEKANLDYSKKNGDGSEAKIEAVKVEQVAIDNWDHEKFDDDDEDEDILNTGKKTQKKGGFMSFFQNLTGNKPLDAADLAPVLLQFKEHLIAKNVAAEIADKLCESVSASLEGKKIGSFASVKNTIRTALEEAVTRVLTPKRNIDILSDAIEAKKQKRPYSIVFVGVNGVGKSTNLAKVCYFFKSEGLQVLIAACDTFRSGAVEQLNVHAKRLNVELFERGYRDDPTLIAQDAIRQAKKEGKDVVLIDTAGRMQDNELLMSALSKLVNTVKPDLVLFVGEALVGNDAVDQLTKFNKALMDLSKDKNARLIDGIILSKFDTIDDKVGAAISMVYTTGSPIVFLGVGQHYTDIRRLNVGVVTKALLKGS
eukprot:TRINITY_DN7572_c0_g1_i1.p1 TRINITY_DN7572_c0_g1~~TRINITY_DN7572_c0_g1_i1.p1  ORF type:complete len:607 (+),score=211.21 TRINITY_DN7572_c0_g1_i1:88-1908(+)